MNVQQKKILTTITKGKEEKILQEVFAHFFDKGFGSITKVETDIFLYYLIDKYQKSSNLNLSNFEWSSFLKISERKLKNLQLETGIRYSSDEDNDEFNSWIRLLEFITEGTLEFETKDKVILTVENPYLLRFIQHKLKKLKLPTADYSFNSEKIKLKTSSLEKLLAAGAAETYIGEGKSIAEEKLKHAKWTNYKKDSLKTIQDMLVKAMPGFISKGLFGG